MTPQTSPATAPYWTVVVADESRVLFYARDSMSGPLRELFSLDNDTARKKTDQLISDSGGRSFDSYGKGRHTMGHEKADPKKIAAMAFAKQIADLADVYVCDAFGTAHRDNASMLTVPQ